MFDALQDLYEACSAYDAARQEYDSKSDMFLEGEGKQLQEDIDQLKADIQKAKRELKCIGGGAGGGGNAKRQRS